MIIQIMFAGGPGGMGKLLSELVEGALISVFHICRMRAHHGREKDSRPVDLTIQLLTESGFEVPKHVTARRA